jgi:hypothetical protein
VIGQSGRDHQHQNQQHENHEHEDASHQSSPFQLRPPSSCGGLGVLYYGVRPWMVRGFRRAVLVSDSRGTRSVQVPYCLSEGGSGAERGVVGEEAV